MKAGDRVLWIDAEDESGWPALGTLSKVSPAGYVMIEWDRNVVGYDTYLSPLTAPRLLRVVDGEDARALHDWTPKQGWDPPLRKPYSPDHYICATCGTQQTEANYLEKCR